MPAPPVPALFTIVSANYIAFAATLMQSVRQFHPEMPRFIVLSDEMHQFEGLDLAAELSPATNSGIAHIANMKLWYASSSSTRRSSRSPSTTSSPTAASAPPSTSTQTSSSTRRWARSWPRWRPQPRAHPAHDEAAAGRQAPVRPRDHEVGHLQPRLRRHPQRRGRARPRCVGGATGCSPIAGWTCPATSSPTSAGWTSPPPSSSRPRCCATPATTSHTGTWSTARSSEMRTASGASTASRWPSSISAASARRTQLFFQTPGPLHHRDAGAGGRPVQRLPCARTGQWLADNTTPSPTPMPASATAAASNRRCAIGC